MKYRPGGIIEFWGRKSGESKTKILDETYVDRITEVCVYDNGKIGYWTQIYPELCGHESEIQQSDIIRGIEFKTDNMREFKVPEFPFKSGQKIQFSWDVDKQGRKVYLRETIKETHYIINEKGVASFRISTESCYICFEDDHEVELLTE